MLTPNGGKQAIVDAEQLLDAAPDAMVVVGRDGVILVVNLQAQNVFGYSRQELVGQSLNALMPQRFRASHGGHLERFFAHPTTRPMGNRLDLFALTKDGRELPIEVSLSPVRTQHGEAVCAAIRDVSGRKATEDAAKLNAERLEHAVESIEDALALYDADDRLVLCNSAYREQIGTVIEGALVGRRYDEVLNAWLSEAVFAGEQERARFYDKRLAERRQPRSTFELRTRDGHSLRVMNRRTQEAGIVQTVWDLTDDMRREQELQTAQGVAEAASAAKSEFLSSMSHELRTPLNAILGFAQLLKRDKKVPLVERHAERIDHILKGGEHLLRLIDDVLDLSRIEAGRVSVSPEPVEVRDALSEVKSTLDPMATRAQIELVLEPVAGDIPNVIADRTRFKQILMNFGSNAIKYGRPGGTATFVTRRIEDRVRVTVADDGIGIPADKHDRIFQPFFRGGQEAGPIEGTGIGLTITKRLAELMNGRVGFASVEGQGSTFWIELPVHQASRPAASRPEAGVGPNKAALTLNEGDRYVVVYVEDNPSNIAFMRDLLGDLERVDLITAPTAEIGIELVRAHQPAVVIMDINLPGMSGLEATKLLKQWPETQHIPVIALTAAAMPRDALRFRDAGFHKYLTKPVQVEALMQVLEDLRSR